MTSQLHLHAVSAHRADLARSPHRLDVTAPVRERPRRVVRALASVLAVARVRTTPAPAEPRIA